MVPFSLPSHLPHAVLQQRSWGGRLISGTLVEVEKVTEEGRGLVMVRSWERLLLTWVQSSMVSTMPEGVDRIAFVEQAHFLLNRKY